MLKDEILNLLCMDDILSKYNIKIKNKMCSCPFHTDKDPSMKIYDKTFYCFSCNRTGDLIQFVQYLFNLSFKEAMKKIDYDFSLNLNFDFSKKDILKYKKIQKEIEEKRIKKELYEKRKKEKFILIADLYLAFKKRLEIENKKNDYNNWEDKTLLISNLQNKMEILNLYMDDLYEKK